ncbi:hypothetical protein HWQ46_18575 [Shewanella sp. D64]|uniref:hypothetical protein n=1 Tax=unclassified Shewanella TaxID=196818 RepID=UPI0022BA3FCC|nr:MULTISPECIES: hypothetical protein [unclassified Shewanella]MEC4727553.1 hypothetical protein [Shewanella sp. D64]MEC4739804.1 hypothetical protein [Shewanella sp. E94]WBJ95808.1 hypothetical protein HWQ47_01320 [Shewanella sp. MTB7]
MKKHVTLYLLTSLNILAFTAYANTNYAIDDSHSTSTFTAPESNDIQNLLDLGWDSNYISEGRNNLDKGGIFWSTAAVQYKNINVYTIVGRGDSQHYTEWNFGIEYGFNLTENFAASLGYQRLEFYGDERAFDNEIFGSLEYTAVDWLVPSVNYTYSTQAAGYFVEVSLHSNWELLHGLTISPYVTQGFDFQYTTEEYDGANHFQLGLEAEYLLSQNISLSGHIDRTFAQEDIKLEAKMNKLISNLDQTFAGVHLTWIF